MALYGDMLVTSAKPLTWIFNEPSVKTSKTFVVLVTFRNTEVQQNRVLNYKLFCIFFQRLLFFPKEANEDKPALVQLVGGG